VRSLSTRRLGHAASIGENEGKEFRSQELQELQNGTALIVARGSDASFRPAVFFGTSGRFFLRYLAVPAKSFFSCNSCNFSET
jgi:hypothetical protein